MVLTCRLIHVIPFAIQRVASASVSRLYQTVTGNLYDKSCKTCCPNPKENFVPRFPLLPVSLTQKSGFNNCGVNLTVNKQKTMPGKRKCMHASDK